MVANEFESSLSTFNNERSIPPHTQIDRKGAILLLCGLIVREFEPGRRPWCVVQGNW